MDKKVDVVPYDTNEALRLFAKREGYGHTFPPFYTSNSAVTDIPPDLVGRNKLIIKPKNAQELMQVTTGDDA